ncbi:MAG: protein kinase [Deltaproteobacteria bacterium]
MERPVFQGAVIDGRYALDRPLGEGAFGEVWHAVDMRLSRRSVAIKFLRSEHLEHPELVARFDAEADALALLNHPCVVGIMDRGEWKGLRFLVTEFVAGGSLAEWLEQHRASGVLPDLGLVADLFDQVCAGVEAAHAVRAPGAIVHRDIKPENVLVRTLPDGKLAAKVLDFGIAQLGERRGTRTGMLLGTPAYMAPEQAMGLSGAVGPWTDVFALGVVLVEMLTLRFQLDAAETLWATAMQSAASIRPSLFSLRAGVAPGVWDVAVRALSPRGADRFADAGALRRALHAAWQESPVSLSPQARIAETVVALGAPRGVASAGLASRDHATSTAGVVRTLVAPGPSLAGLVPTARAGTPRSRATVVKVAAVCVIAAGAVFAGLAARRDGGSAHDTAVPTRVALLTGTASAPATGGSRVECIVSPSGGFLLRAAEASESVGRAYPTGTRLLVLSAGAVPRHADRWFRVRVVGSGEEGFAALTATDTGACPQFAPGLGSVAAMDTPSRPSLALRPSFTSASSYIDNPGHPLGPDLAFDSNPATAWNENAPGPGTGEWIQADLGAPARIRQVRLSTGWDYVSPRSGDLFALNSHLRRVRLTFDGANPEVRDIASDEREITIDGRGRVARIVRIEALDVYPGARWADLCLSDVAIEGEAERDGEGAIRPQRSPPAASTGCVYESHSVFHLRPLPRLGTEGAEEIRTTPRIDVLRAGALRRGGEGLFLVRFLDGTDREGWMFIPLFELGAGCPRP